MVIGSLEFKERSDLPEAPTEGRRKVFVGPDGLPRTINSTGEIGLFEGPEGPSGADGQDGASAYQVAVANGFSGTEAEWLLSLKGADGDEGPAGPAPAGTGIVTVVNGVLQSPQSLAQIGAELAWTTETHLHNGLLDTVIPARRKTKWAITFLIDQPSLTAPFDLFMPNEGVQTGDLIQVDFTAPVGRAVNLSFPPVPGPSPTPILVPAGTRYTFFGVASVSDGPFSVITWASLNPDWNAAHGPTRILNKPTIPQLTNTTTPSNLGTAAAVGTSSQAARADHVHARPTPAEIGAQPAGSYATLDTNNKLTSSQIPDLAITDFLGACDNQTEMLAKPGQKGDWVTRSDDGKVYVITGDSPSNASSWTALSYPVAPPAPVSSVAGKTGVVTLNGGDVTVSSDFTVTNVSQGAYSNGSVIAAGTSLETVIKSMLQTFQAPTVSISAGPGLSLTIELRSNYSGTINRNYAQNNGGSVTGYRLQLNGADSQTGASLPANFSVSENQVTSDREWKLFVDYAASGPVNAGTASSGLLTISPVRRSFFGADTQTTAVTNSTGVRGLTAGAGSTGNVLGLTNGATYSLKIPVGTKRVTIAYPANLRDLTSVAYVEAGNAAVLDTFTKSDPNIQVSAAVTGQDEIAYKVYTYITQAGFESAATYNITI